MCTIIPTDANSFWTMVAALFAGLASWAGLRTLRMQSETLRLQTETLDATNKQERLMVWREMSDKFDTQLREARYKAALAFNTSRKFTLLAQCQPIMDFFEDLAHFVQENLIDVELARSTFENTFVFYFLAARTLMIEEREDDRTTYEKVFALKELWAPDDKIGTLQDGKLVGGNVDFLELIRFFEAEYMINAPLATGDD